jgi:hypothetical protein
MYPQHGRKPAQVGWAFVTEHGQRDGVWSINAACCGSRRIQTDAGETTVKDRLMTAAGLPKNAQEVIRLQMLERRIPGLSQRVHNKLRATAGKEPRVSDL